VAIEDIDDDEIIFSIPRSAVLNAQNAKPLAISKRLAEKMPSWLVSGYGVSMGFEFND